MKFLEKEWAKIALVSYTAWAFYALAVLTIAPNFIYYFFGVDTNPFVWGWLQLVAVVGGIVGRLVLQPHENHLRRKVIIAGLLAIILIVSVPAIADEKPRDSFDSAAFTLISKWEGKRNASYQDIVGVWTICYGHTKDVRPFDYRTDGQCRDLLVQELAEYRAGVNAYFTPETKRHRLPVLRDVAYTSLAYNVGIRSAGRSTATRRLNRGDIKGGCEAIGWWNRAGGRIVRGLVRRRSEERRYCLNGIAK